MSETAVDRLPYDKEELIRRRPVCCGCGGPKDRDLVVCWPCFKFCTAPYKYAGGSLVAWVAAGGPVEWVADCNGHKERRPIRPQPALLAKLVEGGAA